jgi:hypothetical protein
MPLARFVREGHLLEIRVPWHTETLWFVPDERDAAALGRDGAGRGRVWTAGELIAVMALPDRTPAVVRSLALAKLAIDGDLVDVRPGAWPWALDADQKLLRVGRADGLATALSARGPDLLRRPRDGSDVPERPENGLSQAFEKPPCSLAPGRGGALEGPDGHAAAREAVA